jgi:hypothetical protein
MFSLPKASGSALSFPAAEGESSNNGNAPVEAGGRQRVNGQYDQIQRHFYGPDPHRVFFLAHLTALVGATKPNVVPSEVTMTSAQKTSNQPAQKTAAAQELEDMLKQADEEEGRKVHSLPFSAWSIRMVWLTHHPACCIPV